MPSTGIHPERPVHLELTMPRPPGFALGGHALQTRHLLQTGEAAIKPVHVCALLERIHAPVQTLEALVDVIEALYVIGRDLIHRLAEHSVSEEHRDTQTTRAGQSPDRGDVLRGERELELCHTGTVLAGTQTRYFSRLRPPFWYRRVLVLVPVLGCGGTVPG